MTMEKGLQFNTKTCFAIICLMTNIINSIKGIKISALAIGSPVNLSFLQWPV